MQEIYAIIYKEDEDDDYSIWSDFCLSKKENERIEKILEEHYDEGGSSRGDFVSILNDFAGHKCYVEDKVELKDLFKEHQGHSVVIENGCLVCKDCNEIIIELD